MNTTIIKYIRNILMVMLFITIPTVSLAKEQQAINVGKGIYKECYTDRYDSITRCTYYKLSDYLDFTEKVKTDKIKYTELGLHLHSFYTNQQEKVNKQMILNILNKIMSSREIKKMQEKTRSLTTILYIGYGGKVLFGELMFDYPYDLVIPIPKIKKMLESIRGITLLYSGKMDTDTYFKYSIPFYSKKR